MFKKEIRVIGWDDAPFVKGKKQLVTLAGVIFRGGNYIDGLLSTKVEYDGLDATEKIIDSLNRSRHKDQLKIVMTDGISFAGFNLVDIKEVFEKTSLPVIVIQRKKPDIKKFVDAMKIFDDFDKRRDIVRRAGKIYKFGKTFFQKAGLTRKDAEEIISLTTTHSAVPEPIRVAHLIATGLSGESHGRA
ncbi:MAG: DUF99 family protein [Candidatus Aenigmarchaeota archaeon]|nr:DUF99 family protein [Candidatus Aenigmarchaeota archaeon]